MNGPSRAGEAIFGANADLRWCFLQIGGNFAQERVADDFVGFQVNDSDAGSFTGETVEQIIQAVVSAGEVRIVDLGEVTHNDHLGAVTEAGDEGAGLSGRHVLNFVVDNESFREAAAAHLNQRNKLDSIANELFHFAFGGGVGFRGDGDLLNDFDDLIEVVGESEGFDAGFVFTVAGESANVVTEARVARANDNGVVTLRLDAVVAGGDAEEGLAGAEFALDDDNGDFVGGRKQGFQEEALAGGAGADVGAFIMGEGLVFQRDDGAGSCIEAAKSGERVRRRFFGATVGRVLGWSRNFGLGRGRKIANWGGVAYFDKLVGMERGAGVDLLLPGCQSDRLVASGNEVVESVGSEGNATATRIGRDARLDRRDFV